MPTRLIHESLCTSESIARCSPRAQDAFPRLVLYADNYGVFQVNVAVIRGRLWPLREDVGPKEIEAWLAEYEQEGMIHTWEQDGKRYGHFANWPRFQRADPRLNRKWPAPPCCLGKPGGAPGSPGDFREVPGNPAGQSQSQGQSQEHEQGQSQSKARGNGDSPVLKEDGLDWTTLTTLARRLKDLDAAQVGKVLTAFVAGFGRPLPSGEYLAGELSHLVNKVLKARDVRNLYAYALKAVETYHRERVPIKT